jgi:hypothetical protein
MIVDAAGVVHEESHAFTRLHVVANAPIFSFTDAFFGLGIVGGPHVRVFEHAASGSRGCCSYPWRRESERYQDTACRFWRAEV